MEDLEKWRIWGNGGPVEMYDLVKRRTWGKKDLGKWRIWGNRGSGEMEDLEKWRTPEN